MQYRTLEPIHRNGHTIPAGELIDLTEPEAKQLLAVNAIEPNHKPFARRLVVPGTPD